GAKEERPYTLAVRRSGVDPTGVEGTYVQRGFLPRWLATFLGIFVAVAVAFVMIWIAYKPQVRTSATEQTQQAGVALSPSATPETLPSSAESAPAAEPEQPAAEETGKDDAGGGGGGGSGGGDGGDKKPAKPAVKPVVPARNVMLRNATTHMCADIPGRGKGQINGVVQQANCHEEGDNEYWHLEVKYKKGGPGGADLFQIRNATDEFCMDLGEFGARPEGTGIAEFHCDGTMADNQLWWVDKQESGDYWIRNYASNHLCLNVKGQNGGTETPLNIAKCTNTDDQEWQIIHPNKD
ncbi:RICIN domain-containing protein, partial [Streptomyces ardesiacus]